MSESELIESVVKKWRWSLVGGTWWAENQTILKIPFGGVWPQPGLRRWAPQRAVPLKLLAALLAAEWWNWLIFVFFSKERHWQNVSNVSFVCPSISSQWRPHPLSLKFLPRKPLSDVPVSLATCSKPTYESKGKLGGSRHLSSDLCWFR